MERKLKRELTFTEVHALEEEFCGKTITEAKEKGAKIHGNHFAVEGMRIGVDGPKKHILLKMEFEGLEFLANLDFITKSRITGISG